MDQPQLTKLTLNQTTVVGQRDDVRGTVTLDRPAPAPGLVVELFISDSSVAEVPESVTVLPNAISATFPVSIRFTVANMSQDEPRQAQIIALKGTITKVATLTVELPAPVDFKFSPTSIKRGEVSTGTIALSGPAPGRTSVELKGLAFDDLDVVHPDLTSVVHFRDNPVEVEENAEQVTFKAHGIQRIPVLTVEVTASYLGRQKVASLDVGQEKPSEGKHTKDNDVPPEHHLKVKGPETKDPGTEIIFLGMYEQSSDPGGAEQGPARGRAFVRPHERPETGQHALERLPADEE
jgi:hypothetical protein